MDKYCDLHAHSTASDGSLTPTQLLHLAAQTGLKAVALCDHNSVAGLYEFTESAKALPVEAVPGIEFSTEYCGIELHIIALYIRPEHYASINRILADFQERKKRSNIELVKSLNRAGIEMDYESICKDRSYINRAHIAEALTEKGITASVKEAFKIYLAPERGYYVPPKRPDAMETIRFIKSLGALAILAHPFLNLNETQLEGFLSEAVPCGLDAMETMYAKYDTATTMLAKQIAERYQIAESGGSDFHGNAKPDIALGKGRGNLAISVAVLEELKKRLR